MPLLHRLACFRDDVVFVILLVQMYIYRVDPTRVNEYGQMTEEAAKKLTEGREKAKKLLGAKEEKVEVKSLKEKKQQ